IGGKLNLKTVQSGLSGVVDGTFRLHCIFNENGRVALPESQDWLEGLYTFQRCQLRNRPTLRVDSTRSRSRQLTTLLEGTGGDSRFAVEFKFAKAIGTIVIATTSSAAKAGVLKKLGADHVIDYKEVLNLNWG
ncbi:hypothetical protein A1O1_08020, partial [Capronia coronata CBS 617.96]